MKKAEQIFWYVIAGFFTGILFAFVAGHIVENITGTIELFGRPFSVAYFLMWLFGMFFVIICSLTRLDKKTKLD